MSKLNRLERGELIREELKRNVSNHLPILDDYYDFTNDNRGVALIFNHEVFIHLSDRPGTQKDGNDLKALLEGLKFDVRVYKDLKLDELKEVLKKVSMEDHTNNDCLWVTVMSHGSKDDILSAADKDYSVQELWQNFLGNSCKSLIGKPKLFFIQACRGSMLDSGARSDDTDDHSTKKNLKIPSCADFLVMYSTAEGHYAFRNRTDGSWFIQALCEEFQLNSHEDLMHILTRVNRKVALEKMSQNDDPAKNEKKQMPQLVTMLTKLIYFSCNSPIRRDLRTKKPEKLNVLKMTDELCYDISNANRGIALIFYHLFNDKDNIGVQKDADDLKDVLKDLQFDVRDYMNLDLYEMRDILKKVSKEDHTNNDCFLIAVNTIGTNTDVLTTSRGFYDIGELWENFVGDNCKSLIGKPKLVFIQADRGYSIDYGVLLKKTLSVKNKNSDKVDSINMMQVIPSSADFLVMYSTTEGHYSFRNETDGSWFIQALCKELNANHQDDLLTILTRVNNRVAFEKQSNTPGNFEMDCGKQMPNFVSKLTKSIYISNNSIPSDAKEFCYDFTNANRGVALIFNHEVFSQSVRRGTQKDGDDLKAVLEGLKFDVRIYMDQTFDEIKEVLQKVSMEDHTNNDCLWVTVMSHGSKDDIISAADKDYYVQVLWQNFLGKNCESLIGKPKLFFIQSSKGDSVDPGASLKSTQLAYQMTSDSVAADLTEINFVIPKFSDLLVMRASDKNRAGFSVSTGSCFIQALCEELKINQENSLMSILTAVNRRVAFGRHIYCSSEKNFHEAKQMPNFLSMLTKKLYFPPKSSLKFK